MAEAYSRDGHEYTASNHRMRYNPEFHENHRQPFTEEDLAYMCAMWDSTKKADIALALGRTHGTILSKAHALKKSGKFEHYKKLGSLDENDD